MKNQHYPKLFERGSICGIDIKNRIVRQPMGTALGNPDGSPSWASVKAYAEAAEGGAGIVYMDNAAITDFHHVGLSLWNDSFTGPYMLLAKTIKKHGAVPALQLAHPGRDAAFVQSGDLVSSSRVMWEPWYYAGAGVPRELSIEEIREYEEHFANAALRAQMAGFEIVDIHAACGTLPSNFLSPLNNTRNDMYGGSLHNRMRFLIETIKAIKAKCPKLPLSVRMSGIDFEPGGITAEETAVVARACQDAGADIINITWGSHAEVVQAAGLLEPHGARNIEALKLIREAVTVPLMMCGGVYTPEIGEKLLEDGVCDYVGLGKPALADPFWAKKAQEGRADDIKPCIACGVGCHDRGLLGGGVIQCAVNPSLYMFDSEPYEPAAEQKKVVVVGAGPGGCEAALTAAQRGHDVTMYERRAIGGILKEATAAEYKQDLWRLAEYYERQVKKAGITVVNKEATADDIAAGGFDACIVATGGIVRTLDFPGVRSENVVYAVDFLSQGCKTDAQNIIVVGGGIVGAETALIMAEDYGRNVTITTRQDNFYVPGVMGIAYMGRLAKAGAKVEPRQTLVAVEDGKAVFAGPRGVEKKDADLVVLSPGFLPNTSLCKEIEEKVGIETFVIGDAKAPRLVMDAVHEGYIAACQI